MTIAKLKKMIKGTIKEKGIDDRHKLLDIICEELVNEFPGDELEPVLKKIKIETTDPILKIIDDVLAKA